MSDKALKNATGKARLSLLPPAPLVDITRVMEHGARKYEDWDWCRSRLWMEYLDAVLRHLALWQSGEDLDGESGLPHLSHAACTLLFLIEFARTGAGTDDRPKLLARPAVEPVEGPPPDPRPGNADHCVKQRDLYSGAAIGFEAPQRQHPVGDTEGEDEARADVTDSLDQAVEPTLHRATSTL